jgi:hypothetical protein
VTIIGMIPMTWGNDQAACHGARHGRGGWTGSIPDRSGCQFMTACFARKMTRALPGAMMIEFAIS